MACVLDEQEFGPSTVGKVRTDTVDRNIDMAIQGPQVQADDVILQKYLPAEQKKVILATTDKEMQRVKQFILSDNDSMVITNIDGTTSKISKIQRPKIFPMDHQIQLHAIQNFDRNKKPTGVQLVNVDVESGMTMPHQAFLLNADSAPRYFLGIPQHEIARRTIQNSQNFAENAIHTVAMGNFYVTGKMIKEANKAAENPDAHWDTLLCGTNVDIQSILAVQNHARVMTITHAMTNLMSVMSRCCVNLSSGLYEVNIMENSAVGTCRLIPHLPVNKQLVLNLPCKPRNTPLCIINAGVYSYAKANGLHWCSAPLLLFPSMSEIHEFKFNAFDTGLWLKKLNEKMPLSCAKVINSDQYSGVDYRVEICEMTDTSGARVVFSVIRLPAFETEVMNTIDSLGLPRGCITYDSIMTSIIGLTTLLFKNNGLYGNLLTAVLDGIAGVQTIPAIVTCIKKSPYVAKNEDEADRLNKSMAKHQQEIIESWKYLKSFEVAVQEITPIVINNPQAAEPFVVLKDEDNKLVMREYKTLTDEEKVLSLTGAV